MLMLATASSLVCGVAGCGGSDEPRPSVSTDERGVLATIDELQAASRRGDAGRICSDLFTRQLARSIRAASKRSCASEIGRTLTTPDARYSVARGIRITGSRAIATVRERTGRMSRLLLVKEGPRWRIDRITPVRPA